MKTELFFVGSKFIYNSSLAQYCEREIVKKVGTIASINYFKESENALFLDLEKALSSEKKLIIISTKISFSVIGKLLCTISSDNQILQENMLIPSQTSVFGNNSYLLEYESSQINVIQMDENQDFPALLLQENERSATVQLFNETINGAKALLESLSKTYEVKLTYIPIIEEWIEIKIESKRFGNIEKFIASTKTLLSNKIIASPNIYAYIIEKLTQKQRKLSFAESCTGGLLAYKFTQESGASNVFEGSLVTYSNSLKSNWLAVEDLTLDTFGAVSKDVVEEMSEGVLNVSYADYGISISGIAGPGGGTELKPVGTVHISARSRERVLSEVLYLKGDRVYIQEQSVKHAIKLLINLDKTIFF